MVRPPAEPEHQQQRNVHEVDRDQHEHADDAIAGRAQTDDERARDDDRQRRRAAQREIAGRSRRPTGKSPTSACTAGFAAEDAECKPGERDGKRNDGAGAQRARESVDVVRADALRGNDRRSAQQPEDRKTARRSRSRSRRSRPRARPRRDCRSRSCRRCRAI